MAKKPRRIPEEKVFVTRELSKEVTTLTITNALQRDPQIIRMHVTASQQRHKKRVQPQL